jgi:hypothetical protein
LLPKIDRLKLAERPEVVFFTGPVSVGLYFPGIGHEFVANWEGQGEFSND